MLIESASIDLIFGCSVLESPMIHGLGKRHVNLLRKILHILDRNKKKDRDVVAPERLIASATGSLFINMLDGVSQLSKAQGSIPANNRSTPIHLKV